MTSGIDSGPRSGAITLIIEAMEYVALLLVAILVVVAVVWLALRVRGGRLTFLPDRRNRSGRDAEETGRRLAERMAEELARARQDDSALLMSRTGDEVGGPGPQAHQPRPRSTAGNGSGSAGVPAGHGPKGQRVYRVHAARRRARSGGVNLYAMLGVSPTATEDEIVQAYRQHASLVHPDKFQNDPRRRATAEQRLRQLNHAMHVLRDPTRRAQHDAQLQI